MQSVTQFDFHSVLEETPGAALVLFSAAACGACRAWKGLLQRYRETHPGLHIFEVDAGLEPGLVAEFEVFHLPALFLYRDGCFHAAINCPADPVALETAIARALAASPAEAP